MKLKYFLIFYRSRVFGRNIPDTMTQQENFVWKMLAEVGSFAKTEIWFLANRPIQIRYFSSTVGHN